ncbi:hypothetical protein [Streptomyces sp. NPDC046942]|uniref:hypothetical protein n=1 Tax=Streptomyces sp. NPDC046942 TaxID=3155137 RepID=UPI0033EE4B89
MDPEIVALAGTAGSTLVALMVTDGWQQARDGILQWWRRHSPDSAEDVAGVLESSRSAALAAHVSGGSFDETLARDWAGRVAELITSRRDAEHELRTLLNGWDAAGDAQTVRGGVHMEAHVTGSSRVYQAGRDQHITER